MPKINPYESQVRVAGPAQSRDASQSDFGTGAAVQQLGNAMGQLGEFLLKKAEDDDIGKAKVAAGEFRARQRIAFYEQSKFAESTIYQKASPASGTPIGGGGSEVAAGATDADVSAHSVDVGRKLKKETAISYDNFSEKFVGSMNDQRLAMRGQFKTKAGRDAFDELSARTRDELTEKAFVTQATLAGTKAKVDATRLLDVYRNDVNTDPESLESTLQDWKDGIAMDRRIPAEVRDELMRKGAAEIAKSAAFGVIDKDPAQGMQMLREGKFDQYMDADARIAMQKYAVTKYEQQLSQQERNDAKLRQEAERGEKRLYDSTAKDAAALASEGKLTSAWVMENKSNLSRTDFEHFLKRSGGDEDGGKTDPNVYGPLRARAGQGIDVRQEALAAYKAGHLKYEAYNTIVGEVEGSSAEVAKESWYKTGRQHITTMLAPPPGATTGFEASMQAQALDEWLTWSAEHKNASNADREKARDQIVERHRAYSWDQITPAIPTPRYHEGGRDTIDPQASLKKAFEALQKKEISEAEYRREVAILKKWQDANRNRPAPVEQPKVKK